MPDPMREEERARPSRASCEECGAVVPEGRATCQKLFDEVLARELSDPRYARLHRLTVDTYSLQHPGQFMRSGKSFAAHLTGMCAALGGGDAPAIHRAVQRWLDGPKAVERPVELPPRQRGERTIAHVHAATNPWEHERRVREWADSTWNAWRAHHDLAWQWIARATAEAPKR